MPLITVQREMDDALTIDLRSPDAFVITKGLSQVRLSEDDVYNVLELIDVWLEALVPEEETQEQRHQ